MNNTALGILSALFILIGSWVLSFTTFCGGSADTTAKFLFTDGAFKSSSVDAFSFKKNGVLAAVPASTNGELRKVAAHFKSNEDRTLSLVGNYYPDEKYTGDSNLGKERAEVIKTKLVKFGAPADRIITSGKKMTGTLEGNKIYNAVVFEGIDNVEGEAETNVEEKAFSVLDPYAVRFATGVTKPEMTDELRNYLDLALTYINENPGKVLMVTGYTDNEGDAKSNLKLSKKRAEIVRRLLRDNGVKSGQVEYQGKGDANELESNDTEEGRALNRRVEITIE